MSGSEDEAFLVARARTGDRDAFAELVRRYQRLVFAVSYRLLGDPDLAEDVAQETFIRAFLSLEHFRGTTMRAWLLRIAHNAALDQLRASARRRTVPLEHASEHASVDVPEPGIEQAGLRAALEAALAALPVEQRAVVVLADVEGLPYEEIAQTLGLPLGTVKSRLARARMRLRTLLESDPRARELLGLSGRLPDREGESPERLIEGE
jgi:RNA polymerase sigma-70 factor (ECF subfamily)